MAATSSVDSRPAAPTALIASILAAGLVAGSLDIFAAAAINHAPPANIARFIATGLVGREALKGPAYFVGLGVVAQWVMSWIISAVFLVARTRLPLLAQRPVAAGLLYGPVIYAVMTFVVVPLSAAPKGHATHAPLWYAENLLAMIVFGLVVALTPGVLMRLSGKPA